MPLGWTVLLIGFVLSLVAVTSTHTRPGVAIAETGACLVGVLVAAIAFFVATGVYPTSVVAGDDDQVVASTQAGGSTAAGGSPGSRENPAAPGETVTVGDRDIVVSSFDRDATEKVMGTTQLDDPPPNGRQWALVDLTATYVRRRPGHHDPHRRLVRDRGRHRRDPRHHLARLSHRRRGRPRRRPSR